MTSSQMAPRLSEDDLDDLIYFARAGEKDDLLTHVSALAQREGVSTAEILVSAKDDGKSTCLHMATGNGHLDVVKLLCEQFASRPKEEKQEFLDAPNEFGNTGLHWAALGGHLETVKLLMEQGASPAIANDKNYIPLDLASFGEKFEVVDYFLKQSGEAEDENGEGLEEAAAGIDLEGGGDDTEGKASQT